MLDTNVLSELRRPKPDVKVVAFVSAQSLDLPHVSAVTFAEIRFEIESVGDLSRRMELNDRLEHKLRPRFEKRVLGITEELHAEVAAAGRNRANGGRTISQPDLIIAATALHHGLTVVSRDTSEYEAANVPVLNPWTGKR